MKPRFSSQCLPLFSLLAILALSLSSCKKEANILNHPTGDPVISGATERSTSSVQYTNRYLIIPSGNNLPANIASNISQAGGTVHRNVPQSADRDCNS
jgi:hypothetical protein